MVLSGCVVWGINKIIKNKPNDKKITLSEISVSDHILQNKNKHFPFQSQFCCLEICMEVPSAF